MLNNRNFWLAAMGAIILLYAGALVMLAQGTAAHPFVHISVIFLLAHVLELPLAVRALRPLNPQWPRVVIWTLLFGLAWWLPAKRGLFTVR